MIKRVLSLFFSCLNLIIVSIQTKLCIFARILYNKGNFGIVSLKQIYEERSLFRKIYDTG